MFGGNLYLFSSASVRCKLINSNLIIASSYITVKFGVIVILYLEFDITIIIM